MEGQVVHYGLKMVHKLYFKLLNFNIMQHLAVLLTGSLLYTTQYMYAAYAMSLCSYIAQLAQWCIDIATAKQDAAARVTL
jgi:hypothetical protein